jgi:hypothetical protein
MAGAARGSRRVPNRRGTAPATVGREPESLRDCRAVRTRSLGRSVQLPAASRNGRSVIPKQCTRFRWLARSRRRAGPTARQERLPESDRRDSAGSNARARSGRRRWTLSHQTSLPNHPATTRPHMHERKCGVLSFGYGPRHARSRVSPNAECGERTPSQHRLGLATIAPDDVCDKYSSSVERVGTS